MGKTLNDAEQYAADVRSGKVVACQYVKLAVERYYSDIEMSADKGFYLDPAAGLRAIKFIERLKHTKGKWAGHLLKLERWQKFIIYNVFGWKKADGARRFSYAYVEVARKNGKTALAAGIALYMLYADNEPRAEVYSVATVRDQAKYCFNDASKIVEKTSLSKRITIFTNSLLYDATGSYMKALSSDAGIHDAYSPHCVIVDEYHAHKTNAMCDVMRSGMGARTQPLMLYITTAGFNKQYPCYLYRRNCINVLQNVVQDESLFAIIYTLDEEDQERWFEPEVWAKANPNLDVSVFKDYIEEQVKDAMNRPEAVRNVKTKNLNMWVDAEKTWILDSKWMECAGSTDIASLDGCVCWGGLDLANIGDITAYVLLFHENERYQLLPFFWIPEESVQRKIEESNAAFAEWINAGYIEVTPGNVTDYNFIKQRIFELNEKYQVRATAYDRWNSSQIIIDMTDEGLNFSKFGQGFSSMSFPTKEFERLVLQGELEHFGNPVLRWMLSSVAIKTDPAGNIKPDKQTSSQKIDGIVASIMALGQYLTEREQPGHVNPYENRGLLEV